MDLKEELLNNKNKIHTTELGVERIKNNLDLSTDDVVAYCNSILENPESSVIKKGKNYYVTLKNTEITINSSSFTIITAHLKK